jgi:predicted porin
MGKHYGLTFAALLALTMSGAAHAGDAADVAALKDQANALKKQNTLLEQRLSGLEKQQAAIAKQQAASGATSGSFLAQAPTKGPAAFLTNDGPLTWNGITVFGTVDAGLGWASYGLPTNGLVGKGDSLVNKYAQKSYFGISPNNMQQTTLGVKGATELLPGLSGVFYAATGINPNSGQLANAPGSVAAQNGLNRTAYSNFSDGPRGGQAFNGQLYAGFSSKNFGKLTFGRQLSLSGELMNDYDPTGGSFAFSVITYNGSFLSGLGDTENVIWDNAIKYRVEYPVNAALTTRFAAIYKFADGSAGCNYLNATGVKPVGTQQECFSPNNNAGQFDVGFSYGGFDFDGVAGYFRQAVTVIPLNAAQALTGSSTFTPNFGPAVTSTGVNTGTLSGVVSDNSGWALAGKYTYQNWKFFAGWAHVIYHNPQDNVGIGGANDQGGYALSTVNNSAFPHAKLLDTFWTGARYAYNEKTDIVGAFYLEAQNSYGWAAGTPGVANTAATSLATCGLPAYLPSGSFGAKIGGTTWGAQSAPRSATCSGNLYGVSAFVDYHFTKRFDVYGGLMYSSVTGGFQSGFYSASNWAPTVGARFTF